MMDPKAIAESFKRDHMSPSQAIILFIACADDCSIEDIVKEIPEVLRSQFEAFIISSSGADQMTIGLGGLKLKEEWILGFKSFYQNRPR